MGRRAKYIKSRSMGRKKRKLLPGQGAQKKKRDHTHQSGRHYRSFRTGGK